MEVLFQKYAQELKAEPSQLNTATDALLKQAAKEHHPHNRLLPSNYIQILLAEINAENIIETNAQAQRYILAMNCLRNILMINFSQLKDNKIFTAIIMNYSLTLSKIVQAERQNMLKGQQKTLKLVARGYIVNEIMLKILQKSHVFMPEILRFTKLALEIASEYISEYKDQQVSQKQFRIISKLAENSQIPKFLYRLGSKKIWKKSYLLLLVSKLFEQLQQFLKTSGFSKNALQIQAYKEISQKYNLFKSQLTIDEQSILQPKQQIQAQNKQNENVYLEQPIQVRQLTPRFYNEEQSVILSKLRRKKQKLTKKIETDLRKGVLVKQQQAQIIEQVRRQKGLRQQKKEQLIIEKQTVQVKKYNRQIKKIKMIRKGGKGKDKGGKDKGGRGGKLGRGREKGKGISRGR